MTQPMDALQQLELMQRYLITLQTCKKCGTCFQNRNHVYKGQVTLCHRCRNHNRPSVVVVKYKSIDNTVSPPVTFREEYTIPIDVLNIDMMGSLNALHNTALISRNIPDENGTQVRKTFYPNSRGSLFHETFQREPFAEKYNPYRHYLIKMYKYQKEII